MIRDLTMIKFDVRAVLDMVTTLSQTWIEKNRETDPEISRDKQKPEENILPNFPLQNWANFLDLEDLLQTTDTARAQLVSLTTYYHYYVNVVNVNILTFMKMLIYLPQ